MHQEVDEHLKHFAPELDGHPRVMQLMPLGVQHIVAKAIAHRPTLLVASEPSIHLDILCAVTSRRSSILSAQPTAGLIIA
jgi:hypothetical protein